jgi:hypothetical protein
MISISRLLEVGDELKKKNGGKTILGNGKLLKWYEHVV